jgi:hypothetical protein
MDIVVWCGVDLLEARRHCVLFVLAFRKKVPLWGGIPAVTGRADSGKAGALPAQAAHRRKDHAL